MVHMSAVREGCAVVLQQTTLVPEEYFSLNNCMDVCESVVFWGECSPSLGGWFSSYHRAVFIKVSPGMWLLRDPFWCGAIPCVIKAWCPGTLVVVGYIADHSSRNQLCEDANDKGASLDLDPPVSSVGSCGALRRSRVVVRTGTKLRPWVDCIAWTPGQPLGLLSLGNFTWLNITPEVDAAVAAGAFGCIVSGQHRISVGTQLNKSIVVSRGGNISKRRFFDPKSRTVVSWEHCVETTDHYCKWWIEGIEYVECPWQRRGRRLRYLLCHN